MNDENVHTWTVEVLIGERDGQTHARPVCVPRTTPT